MNMDTDESGEIDYSESLQSAVGASKESRKYHEERERIIDCFSKELQFQGRNNKEVINSAHRQYVFLDRYLEITRRLKECYDDKLGLRKQEIQKMSAPNEFMEFYDRLTEIKDYHKRNPDEIVGPLSIEYDKFGKIRENTDEASAPMVPFTDEECYGKFLDLHECYQTYINFKGIKPVDYVTYLNTFDKLYEFPKDKKTVAYIVYLKQVLDYLDEFILRAKPMFEFTNREERDRALSDFQKQYNEGKFKGWNREAGSAMASQSSAHLDLSAFNSWEELASIGLVRLKSALLALNIKCGGTLEERAQRLWATKGMSNEELLSMRKVSKKGAAKGSTLKEEQKRDIAFMEAQIYFNMEMLKDERIETIENVQRKQARTLNELEEEDESEEEEEVPKEVDEADESTTIYNPKNLPLDWDGKPIPYWLYKLHGLNMYYTCEICGNETYRGPKAFQQHFSEWRHAHGMRCLNIPNTPQFQNITKINEAIALWSKINTSKADLHHKVEEEEFEDSQGNVISKRVYEDLKRQGIL